MLPLRGGTHTFHSHFTDQNESDEVAERYNPTVCQAGELEILVKKKKIDVYHGYKKKIHRILR